MAWTARFGAAAAVAALALYAALQAVDGVALKHAVDAWAAAAEPAKAARFATAEGIRWLEWGMRSYQSFVLGAALILTGAVVVAARRVSRVIGYLMALSGLAYLAQGWIIGAEGFSPANTHSHTGRDCPHPRVVRVAAGQRMVREGRAGARPAVRSRSH